MTRLFAGTPFDIPPTCDQCGAPEGECCCPPREPPRTPPSEQTLRLSVEKRKKGKMVTVIRGFAIDNDLGELLSHLKSSCGAGGTSRSGEVELQGQHLLRVRAALAAMGFSVKG